MCANDQLKIGFDFSSTLEDNEELSVSVNRDAYINGKLVSSGTKEGTATMVCTTEEIIEAIPKLSYKEMQKNRANKRIHT